MTWYINMIFVKSYFFSLHDFRFASNCSCYNYLMHFLRKKEDGNDKPTDLKGRETTKSEYT